MANPFTRWLRRLFDWLRGQTRRTVEPKILEELVNDRAVLARLECDRPGVVDLWRLVHQSARRNLFVSLVYLPQLREDLGRSGAGASVDSWKRGIAGAVVGADPDQVAATHVLVAVWSSRYPIRQVVRGKVRFLHRTECAAVVFCDLEGNGRTWAPSNRYARQTVRSLMRWLLNLEPPYPTGSWEGLVRLIDWQQRLGQWAQQHLGKEHVLQPPKRPEIRF